MRAFYSVVAFVVGVAAFFKAASSPEFWPEIEPASGKIIGATV